MSFFRERSTTVELGPEGPEVLTLFMYRQVIFNRSDIIRHHRRVLSDSVMELIKFKDSYHTTV